MRTALSPILSSLPPHELAIVLERSVPRRLTRGQRLYVSGDEHGRAHFVTAGILKLVAGRSEGRETIIGVALPGDLIGDVATADPGPQPLDAVAATECRLIGVDAHTLIDTVCRNERAARAFTRALARQLRWTTETVLERSTANVAHRLAGRLMHVSTRVGSQRLRLTQNDLALLAGVSRESTCRTLGRLKRGGVVDYDRMGLRVLRPDLLARITCARRVSAPSR
jgi:CRP-like cAMP-binding protein